MNSLSKTWGGKRPRAGRPRENEHGTSKTAISLPADLFAWIDATRGDTPRSAFIAQILEQIRTAKQ